MAGFNKNEILYNLEVIANIEPSPEALKRAMKRLRETLENMAGSRQRLAGRIFETITKNRIRKLLAAAAVIIFVVLPLGYGTCKIIKHYLIKIKTTETFERDSHIYMWDKVTGGSIPGTNRIETNTILKEALRLIRQGKAEEIKPGVYEVKLSDGKIIRVALPESLKAESKLKTELDEIEELRKAGNFERIHKPEHDFVDANGVSHKFYEYHYTLSSGEVKVTFGFEVNEQNEE